MNFWLRPCWQYVSISAHVKHFVRCRIVSYRIADACCFFAIYCSYDAVQMICSYVLWPLAIVMGVNVADCRKVAELIGTKTFLNEFVAYLQLSQLIGNREILARHVTDNGTWYWSGDDVILTWSNGNDTVLKNGVITV